MNIIGKVVFLLIVWVVAYEVVFYPVSFLVGLVFGFTFSAGWHYMIANQAPGNPVMIIEGVFVIVLDGALSAWIAYTTHKLVWVTSN